MSDGDAKRLIEQLLEHFTPGSVLHLLGGVLRDAADEALRGDDPQRHERLRTAEAALFVFGIGLDSALPG